MTDQKQNAFDPQAYALAMGWDFTQIEATARYGLAGPDADSLSDSDGVALLHWCRAQVTTTKPDARTVGRFLKGDRVKILPEFCEAKEQAEEIYICSEDQDNDERITIQPENWLWHFVPQERIQLRMIHKA